MARLPLYLRTLNRLAATGLSTVSSGDLAEAAGVNSAQLRKDLSYLGSYGTRGVGYDLAHLQGEIGRYIGSTEDWPVVIVGVGHLGTALANYAGLRSRGFRVAALVDPDPGLVGQRIVDVPVTDLSDLERTVEATAARIAIIATPPDAAQRICDRLVAAGVTAVLNFASTVLTAPEGVTIRKVDLGQELQILAYHEQRRRVPVPGAPVAEASAASPATDPSVVGGAL